MAFNVTDLTNLIHSETIVAMISKYQGAKFLDAIFGSGASTPDGQTTESLKAPTTLVHDFDGKAKVVRVPIFPVISGSITELAEANDAAEITYAPTYVDVTITEYGRDKATVTGKAQLQVFDGATAQALATMAAAAADAKEKLISARALAGGTKAVSEGGDTVKYFQISPEDQGAGVFKPSGTLSYASVLRAKAILTDTAEPFDNGLLMGVIHPEAVATLKLEAAANGGLRDFQLYQAGSPFPSNLRKGIVGVWEGIMWFESKNSALVVANGAHGGGNAYKTLIFGKNFLAKAYVGPQFLPLAETSDVVQIPFDDFVIRLAPDATDPHRRTKVATWWFVGGYVVADKLAGVYMVHKISTDGAPSAVPA